MVTAKESKSTQDSLVLRLERNHQCVLRLAKNLNSYRYEPKDYECFVRLRDLKTSFTALAKKQMLLFDEIQYKNLPFPQITERVEATIKEFHRLEKDMASYLLQL